MTQTTDYILKDFTPLKLGEKINNVQAFFEEVPFTHIPVVDNNMFCGSIARQEIEYADFGNKTLNDIKNLILPFYASNNMNWFEVLQYFATYNTNILPVLDTDNHYLGYYELDDFLNLFKCTPFLHEEGVILVISKGVNDYSFSQITQIVESNNANLLGAFVSKIENDVAQITLKLSFHDVNNTLNSFRRYGYQILNDFEKDKYLEELNERSNYLQKYLNI